MRKFGKLTVLGVLKHLDLMGCINTSFYHGCWDIVKGSVCDLVKDFLNNNCSLRLINHTNIALISKIENPETAFVKELCFSKSGCF